MCLHIAGFYKHRRPCYSFGFQNVCHAWIVISAACRYFPAIECAVFDSPLDALLSLCVPHAEAMELVTASWSGALPTDAPLCLLAEVDGGRRVAVLTTEDGRWAACNAFPELACASRSDAARRLKKLLKGGRKGYVAVLPAH